MEELPKEKKMKKWYVVRAADGAPVSHGHATATTARQEMAEMAAIMMEAFGEPRDATLAKMEIRSINDRDYRLQVWGA